MHLEVEGCFDVTRDSAASSTLEIVTVSAPKTAQRLTSVYDDIPQELTYYVVPNSIPSIEKLLIWGAEGLIWRARILKDDIESCLDMLLLQYARHMPQLPLVSSSTASSHIPYLIEDSERSC
jgi:hypothetical protein